MKLNVTPNFAVAHKHNQMLADTKFFGDLGEADPCPAPHVSDPNYISFGKYRATIAFAPTCTGFAQLTRTSVVFPHQSLFAPSTEQYFFDAFLIVPFAQPDAPDLVPANATFHGGIV